MTGTLNASSGTLTPPRAAAFAGIIFAALMIASLGIVRFTLPDNPASPGIWMTHSNGRNVVRLALNLVPFVGIAFLWFMGVLRHRLGASEDQFFATVFLGSGLLFVGSLFASAAAAGALLQVTPTVNIQQTNDKTLLFRSALKLYVPERLRDQDGGSVHVLDLYHSTAHGPISALGCDVRISLRFGAIGGHLKLALDRAAIPTLDTAGQCTDSDSGQKAVLLRRCGHA